MSEKRVRRISALIALAIHLGFTLWVVLNDTSFFLPADETTGLPQAGVSGLRQAVVYAQTEGGLLIFALVTLAVVALLRLFSVVAAAFVLGGVTVLAAFFMVIGGGTIPLFMEVG